MKLADPEAERLRQCELRRQWRLRNPEKVAAQHRASIARRRERAPLKKAAQTIKDSSYREAHLQKKFSMSLAEYEALFKAQGGRCAICFRKESVFSYGKRLRLAVDHCHASNRVRGLLCQACNTALGKADDSPERLEAMAAYLRASRLGCANRVAETSAAESDLLVSVDNHSSVRTKGLEPSRVAPLDP